MLLKLPHSILTYPQGATETAPQKAENPPSTASRSAFSGETGSSSRHGAPGVAQTPQLPPSSCTHCDTPPPRSFARARNSSTDQSVLVLKLGTETAAQQAQQCRFPSLENHSPVRDPVLGTPRRTASRGCPLFPPQSGCYGISHRLPEVPARLSNHATQPGQRHP